jgi:hypothetical protein
MASPAQILANRLNSQKSTGPRSAEGKAASSMNALKHGARSQALLIPGEDPEAFAALSVAYRNEYQPDGPEQELLLDTIVRADWTQRRMARLEAEVFDALLAEAEDATAGAVFLADAAGPNALEKIYRRQQSAHREWYRARAELRRLQQARQCGRPPDLPAGSPLANHEPQTTERSQSAALSATPLSRPVPVFRPETPVPGRASARWTGNEPPAWRL